MWDSNSKEILKDVLEGFYFPHRKWVKIINRAVENRNKENKEAVNYSHILDAILEEVFPKYDFLKRENPNIYIDNVCETIRLIREGKKLKTEDETVISKIIQEIKNDKTFISFPEELINTICDKFKKYRADEENKERDV